MVNYLVTRASLSDDLVYQMVKGVFESRDELIAAHQAARDITTGHDMHATILHLLGIDHERLTVRHNGIDRRLTDVHGKVVRGLIA